LREEDTPVHSIYNDTMRPLVDAGYEFVTEIPTFARVKSSFYCIRKRLRWSVCDRKTVEEIEIPADLVALRDGTSFIVMDATVDKTSRIIIFASLPGKSALKKYSEFFVVGTVKTYSQQFTQLYTFHIDLSSSFHERNAFPIVFALLSDKKQHTYHRLFEEMKNIGWNPQSVHLDFEIAAINALQTIFPQVELRGCHFHFTQCLWRKIQDVGLASVYKKNEDVRMHVRKCGAMAYLPLDKIDDAWLTIQSNAPDDEKLAEFNDYFVENWLDSATISKEMWNCNHEKHRTNNIAEGWNHKLKTLVGRSHPSIWVLIEKLKTAAAESDHQLLFLSLKLLELNSEGNKRHKKYIKFDERIKRILQNFLENNDLDNCLTKLAIIVKLY